MEYIKNYAYKTIIIPTKLQKQLLFNHIFTHNQTWNILLNQKEKEYGNNQKLLEQKKELIYIKSTKQDEMVKEILTNRLLSFNTKVIQQCRMTFIKTISNFIKNKGSNLFLHHNKHH